MKIVVFSILMLPFIITCNSNNFTAKENSNDNADSIALQIVNQRMDAYNQHDFTQFIKLYAEDVKVYTYPDQLLGTGIENIASIFEPKFANKSINVKIVSQMNNGNHVINHEIVTENEKETKYVSIYEVKNELIRSVRFVRDK